MSPICKQVRRFLDWLQDRLVVIVDDLRRSTVLGVAAVHFHRSMNKRTKLERSDAGARRRSGTEEGEMMADETIRCGK